MTQIKIKIPQAVPAAEPKWSKDGKRILFTSARDVFRDEVDIWMIDSDGKSLKKITRRPWAQFNPSWLLSGEEVLFVDSPEIMGDEVCKINLKNQDIVRLTQNRFNDIQPAYLPKEDKIIYASNQNGDYDIWIMDRFGQSQRNLTNHPSHDIMPRPSKNGKKIYFLSDRNGHFQIFSLDIKTNYVRQVTTDETDKKDFAIYEK